MRPEKQNWKGWLVNNLMTTTGECARRIYRGNIPLDGLIINIDQAPVSGKVAYHLFRGTYERPERRAITQHLDPDLTTIELGASIGVVTCVLRRHLHPAARLIALEANPNLINQIRHNLQRNHLDKGVIVRSGAIAYEGATARLQLSRQTTGARVAGTATGDTDTVEVPAVRLSRLLEEYDIEDYALVSDIEGADWDLLQREPDALQNCRQIIIELHDKTKRTAAELRDYIVHALGYKLQANERNVFVFVRPANS